jgi:hypothetical protein
VVVVVQIYMNTGGIVLNMDMLPLTQPLPLLTGSPSAKMLLESRRNTVLLGFTEL